jgi:hypothetical protein
VKVNAFITVEDYDNPKGEFWAKFWESFYEKYTEYSP